jgi:predicted dehydrogenase
MKLGVIGLGSMGKRRVRDLTALGHEVIGFDVRKDRREAAASTFGVGCVESFADLAARGVDAVTVSTPPDQHVEYFERCFDAGIPFFSEANVLSRGPRGSPSGRPPPASRAGLPPPGSSIRSLPY